MLILILMIVGLGAVVCAEQRRVQQIYMIHAVLLSENEPELTTCGISRALRSRLNSANALCVPGGKLLNHRTERRISSQSPHAVSTWTYRSDAITMSPHFKSAKRRLTSETALDRAKILLEGAATAFLCEDVSIVEIYEAAHAATRAK